MQTRSTQEYLTEIDKDPMTVYVLHEKSERRFPIHHHQKDQLTYVEGGIAYVHISTKTFVIPAHHYIWIPRQLDHFIQARYGATAIRTLYFYSYDNDTDPFYNKMGIYPVTNLLKEMILFTEQWNGEIEKTSKAFTFLAAIKNTLPQLSTQALPIVLPTTTNERIQPVLQYLNQHFDESLTLGSVSREFGFSERTLSRLFQSTLNISFLQYLKQLRVVKAVGMMLQTDLNLSEIAYATGYNSLSSFSNSFYEMTNRRPSEFAGALAK
ncbi:MAG TPA: AraC family transcriptional regulator [Flavisolibacter sp.]|nr:AraC family transcriptional regulator [Flavisolibacter sp.]